MTCARTPNDKPRAVVPGPCSHVCPGRTAASGGRSRHEKLCAGCVEQCLQALPGGRRAEACLPAAENSDVLFIAPLIYVKRRYLEPAAKETGSRCDLAVTEVGRSVLDPALYRAATVFDARQKRYALYCRSADAPPLRSQAAERVQAGENKRCLSSLLA